MIWSSQHNAKPRRFRSLTLLVLLCGSAATASSPAFAEDVPNEPDIISGLETGLCAAHEAFVLAVHGGTVRGRHPHERKIGMIEALLPALSGRLEEGAAALDVVHAAVLAMEDSGVFNAGKGAIANQAGVIEMDASIMDGRSLAAGAVAGVSRLKNPVDAARLVMEKSGNVLLIAEGAETFALGEGAEEVPAAYFLHDHENLSDVPLPDDLEVEPPRADLPAALAGLSGSWAGLWAGALNQVLVIERLEPGGGSLVYAQGINEGWGLSEGLWERWPFRFVAGAIVFDRRRDGRIVATLSYRLEDRDTLLADYGMSRGGRVTGTLRRVQLVEQDKGGGTVGAVALDRCGDPAAALSTGGFGSKRPGRVGDSPIVGAGLYAKNGVAAIAATGKGEFFQRGVLAYEVIALMEHAGLSLADASDRVINGHLTRAGGRGGIIAIDGQGHVSMPYNTHGMVRGVVGSESPLRVTVY